MVTMFSEHLGGSYLKGQDLGGREHPVTIEKIVDETVGSDDGDDKRKRKHVVYFVGKKKTLPLNSTNTCVLQQAFGDNPDNCRGAKVILFPEQTRTPSGAPAVGVRIRLPQVASPQPPQPHQPPRAQQTALEPEPVSTDDEFADDDEIPF